MKLNRQVRNKLVRIDYSFLMKKFGVLKFENTRGKGQFVEVV